MMNDVGRMNLLLITRDEASFPFLSRFLHTTNYPQVHYQVIVICSNFGCENGHFNEYLKTLIGCSCEYLRMSSQRKVKLHPNWEAKHVDISVPH